MTDLLKISSFFLFGIAFAILYTDGFMLKSLICNNPSIKIIIGEEWIIFESFGFSC
jgi:hypothetical protein